MLFKRLKHDQNSTEYRNIPKSTSWIIKMLEIFPSKNVYNFQQVCCNDGRKYFNHSTTGYLINISTFNYIWKDRIRWTSFINNTYQRNRNFFKLHISFDVNLNTSLYDARHLFERNISFDLFLSGCTLLNVFTKFLPNKASVYYPRQLYLIWLSLHFKIQFNSEIDFFITWLHGLHSCYFINQNM